MISKNDEAKMVLYNALPKKKYERIFTCKTAKDVWQSLRITHQALDESFQVVIMLGNSNELFLLNDVTGIEESKDLSTLPLDELISNLKVYEVVLEKDSEASKIKKKKYKSLAQKANKVSSAERESCSGSDEEYAMAVRDFKKLFRRRVKFVCQPYDEKKNIQKAKEEKKGKEEQSEQGDGSKDEICLMKLDNNEVRLKVKLELKIQDSGCSRHKMGNKDLFSTYEAINGGNIVFGSNTKIKIIEKDENGVVSRNKARLVAQRYNQQEGIDFDETYAPVARLESKRILLAYDRAHNFKLFQMDVKVLS
uniref:Copia protein n=1 Tax=Tanacetum cinerariifolium TaxID=118510 RepID=A0A6L2M6T4_TANCI|nr:copia protein [Tanacetum cinerariifolium]